MKSFRRSRTASATAPSPSPSPSFDFDLGLDLDSSHDSSTPWRLEEIVARAGEEADQHFLEVSSDGFPDEPLAFDAKGLSTEEDPESNLLADGRWEKSVPPLPPKSSGNLSGILKKTASHELPSKVKINPIVTKFPGKLKQFSQELAAGPNSRIKQFSQELKAEFRRISSNLGVGITNKDYGMVRNGTQTGRRRVIARTKSGTQYALQGLQFISKATDNSHADALWKAVESRFHQLAVNGFLSREDFGFCIGMKDSRDFAKELFDALARRRAQTLQSISLEELREFWILISDQKFDSRLQIFFDMCDKNADGRISEAEVKEIIALSASANKLAKLKDQADEYAALIMEELDPDSLGYIEIAQLESLLLGEYGGFVKEPHPNYSQTLSQNLGPPARTISLVQRKTKATMYFVYENWQRMWVVTLWILVMAGLFTWKFFLYKQRAAFQVMGYCVCIAKGAAEILKLNMALILLPVCRNTITWLRSSRLGSAIPFDDNINFHKTIAAVIGMGVVLHAGLHLTCDYVRMERCSQAQFLAVLKPTFATKPSYGTIILTTVSLSGIFMVMLMSVAFVLATRWFRRNLVKLPWPLHRLTGFNAFWYSHHLFVLVYASLLVHSWFLFLSRDWRQKTTWVYLSFPVLLYSGERTLRALRAGHYTVNIVKAAIYPGNVLALHMTKPPGFKYRSGMYIFLQCPEISTFEWHPFSITSGPDDDCVSVHIRTAGDWTLAMRNLFSKIMAPPVGGKSGLLRVEYNLGDDSKFPRLRIDGPYGAPAQDYRKYDVLLLIGLGIGATPFISILKDLLNTIKMGEQQQPQDSVLDFSSIYENPSPRKKRKARCPTNAYFCWVTKEQGSFDWFKGIMNEVAEIDNKAVIELHNYLTSVYEEGDARSALITMVQSLHHARNGVDIVSGTRVRTHFARPNWKKVFSRVANAHKGSRIGVFYCGPMILAKELRELARDYNHNLHTRFEFHKENF